MLDKINVQDIVALAKQAGDVIMEIYQKDFEVEFKEDESPLTEADKAAHKVIEVGLQVLDGTNKTSIPMLSEEGKNIPYEDRKDWEYFWMVDPVDGTKEFIKKNGEFTVNIALIHQGVPILGVVYAPALGQMYWAEKGGGAFKDGQPLPLKTQVQRETYKIVASRSHMSDETKKFIESIETNKEKELVSIGSSLKICLVAEGEADIYPRIAPTMEWDTAAAHAVVLEAGMDVKGYEKGSVQGSLAYNKPSLLNSFFIAE
ncbi:MAG: 3'(2'),5'-bisphosphate nucleotidase CysQ [Cycloclasticus sp. symbiont of Bathymodiolus heckerae]|nr:MAG: 3'(2'),5'-bisphosphate nucleotidase CysQ [Cycloclasticus sp. symbiont of Bathymodiolus heckerae]